MSLKLFQNGYFFDALPHLFVSTTSMTWFNFQLLGRIDWFFQWPIECMYLLFIISWLLKEIRRSFFRASVFTLNADTNRIGSVLLFRTKYCYVFQKS